MNRSECRGAGRATSPIDRLTWVRFGRAVRSFVFSEVGWKARSLFAVLIALLFAINGLNVVNSYVGARLHDRHRAARHAGFVAQAVLYVGVFAASTVVAVTLPLHRGAARACCGGSG